jgi:phospholipase/carboxylesterase
MSIPTLERIVQETGANPRHAVIWLHGLGADGHDFAPIVPELGLNGLPAIRFIFPHAPVQPVTINGGMAMRAWYDILQADLVRREDETGLRASENAIRELITEQNRQGIASENIVLAGFSQGCAMTLQTGLRLEQRLAGMVCLSGYLPLADKVDAERHDANQNTPIFMAHGSFDPVVAPDRALASRQWLERHGYSLSWHTYPMPHSVCAQEIDDISGFLKTVLFRQA